MAVLRLQACLHRVAEGLSLSRTVCWAHRLVKKDPILPEPVALSGVTHPRQPFLRALQP